MVDSKMELDGVFAALGDRRRRAMLVRLARGPATIAELGRPFELTKQAVSKHVGVLESVGLVRKTAAGRTVRCRLNFAPLGRAMKWIGKLVWSHNLERLGKQAAKQRSPR